MSPFLGHAIGLLIALPLVLASTAAESVVAVQVDSSQTLMMAMKDPAVTTIILNGTTRLERSAWREGEVNLAAGRHISLTRKGDQAVVMLDMNNIVDAIHVSSGATLELVNITVSNLASAVGVNLTEHTRYSVPYFALWPSITTEPNAMVAETSTFTYTWSAPGDGCRGYRGDVESALKPYGLLGNLSFPNHRQEITHLHGSHNLSQPVTDMLDNTIVGYMTTRETDTRTLCLPLPSDGLVGDSDAATGPGLLSGGAQSSGSHGAGVVKVTYKWVIALAVVGSLAAAATAAVLVIMYSHVRFRRRVCQAPFRRVAGTPAKMRMPAETALSGKGDGDGSHDEDASRDCESGQAGTLPPDNIGGSSYSGSGKGLVRIEELQGSLVPEEGPVVPRSPFEDMRRSQSSLSPKEQATAGNKASFVTPRDSASSSKAAPCVTPNGSGNISEDSPAVSMELALLPASIKSTPVSPERSPANSFPWASPQQRPASFSAAAPSLWRGVCGALGPPPPRALGNGRASVPADGIPTSADSAALEANPLADLSSPSYPASPFQASAAPRLSFRPQLSSRQLARLAKQASLTSRTSLCSVSSLVTRVSSGLGSQPAAARSPFERSPFDKALSLKGKAGSESSLVTLNSGDERQMSSTSATSESGAQKPEAGTPVTSISPASTMQFNDSAYTEGDHDAIRRARASHAEQRAQRQNSKPAHAASKSFDSVSSLPASQSKPPVPSGSLKAASTFDSVASLPVSQKQLPHLLKALSGKGSRMSPAASPRARRNSTQESEFADLRFSALIGTGSFGRVYKGFWKGAVVAVKVIVHNASMACKVDTLRESLVGISMQHPHVMTTYKVMTTMKASAINDAPDARDCAARRNGYSVAHLGPGGATEQEMLETWLLLEYCDGGPLDQAIKSSRFKRTMGTILLSLMDIASGMKYLHSLGIVHSDLKGANVLIKSVRPSEKDPRGYVCKLADFGLARVLGSNRTHVSTSTHGTVSYQPMEVLHDGRVTRASDVYSFGMIMLEMFTGVAVFDGYTCSQILYQVFNGVRPAMPDNLPAPYRELIQACWQRDAEHRPTFAEVHDRLLAMYDALPAWQRPVLAVAPRCGVLSEVP